MKIETIEQRSQREKDIATKRIVLDTYAHLRDRCAQNVERLTRELAELTDGQR